MSPARTPEFKKYLLEKDSYFERSGLKKYRGSLSPPIDVPAYSEPGIWAADIVAGAFYQKYMYGDSTYSKALAPVFIGKGERLFWTEHQGMVE